MSTAAAQVLHPNQNTGTAFSVVDRRVPCEHNFQFYVDFGRTHGGPWVRVGLNETEIGIGYLPIKQKLHVETPVAS